MTQLIESYPHLRNALVELCACNGGINRERAEEEFLRATDPIIGADGVDHEDLVSMDAFIATLTEEERSTLVDGEEQDTAALIARAEARCLGLGAKLDALLNEIFEEAV